LVILERWYGPQLPAGRQVLSYWANIRYERPAILVGMCNRTVGVRSDSNLRNPSIDPDRDIRALDVIANRSLDLRSRKRN